MLTVADTAYSIAAVRQEESDLPEADRLFHDPYAAIFRAAGAHAEEGTQRFLGLPFFRELVRIRTRFIDDVVRESLAAGLRQVVLLGAGFDMRGLRLPEIERAGAGVFEVDFPAQLEKKRAILAAGGVAIPAWDRYVGCDFSAADFDRALEGDLATRGFQLGAGAVFVWEGVIAYLSPSAVDRTMAFVARAGGKGSRLVFDRAGDAFESDPLGPRAHRAGFSRFEDNPSTDLWRRWLRGEPHPNAAAFRMGVAHV